MLETEDILHMILHEFGPHVTSVILYGSRVKGGARVDSDYDMLLVVDRLDKNPNDREEMIASAVADILLNSGTRISPIVLTKEEAEAEAKNGSPLFSSILSDYKVLYDPTEYGVQLLDLIKQSRSEMRYVERGRAWNLARTV
jgi:predicted nucleotidyltransferase